MLIKYYLNDNIKAPFEDFALGLLNAWAGLDHNHNIIQVDNLKISCSLRKLYCNLQINLALGTYKNK